MHLLKYILFATMIYTILKYMPNLNMTDENIIRVIVLSTLGLFIFDAFVGKQEHMYVVRTRHKLPLAYTLKNLDENQDEDYITTGLKNNYNDPEKALLHHGQFNNEYLPFDKVRKIIDNQKYYDMPGYYLASNGQFEKDGIPYEKVAKMILRSKLHDLYHQHNHKYKCSPDTHLGQIIRGKGRGYINWSPAAKNGISYEKATKIDSSK